VFFHDNAEVKEIDEPKVIIKENWIFDEETSTKRARHAAEFGNGHKGVWPKNLDGITP
jgi:hypothetical protein